MINIIDLILCLLLVGALVWVARIAWQLWRRR